MPATPAGPLRHRRLRPARRGPHRPDHLRSTAPAWTGTSTPIPSRQRRPGSPPWSPGDRTFAAGCQAAQPGRAAVREHRRRGPGHGRAPPGLGDAKLTYLGFSYGTLLGPPTPSCSRPTSGPWSSTAPSTRPCRSSPSSISSPPASTPSCSSSSPRAPQIRPAPGSRAAARRRPSRPWSPGSGPTRCRRRARARTGRAGRRALRHGRGPVLTRRPGPTWPAPSRTRRTATGRTSSRCSTRTPSRQRHGSYSNLFEANAAVNCLDAPRPLWPSRPKRRRPGVGGGARLRASEPLRRGRVLGLARPGHRHGRPDPRRRVPADRRGRQHRRPGHPLRLGPVPRRRARPRRAAHPGRRRSHRLRAAGCIRDDVDRYLIDLTVPAPGTRCPSD